MSKTEREEAEAQYQAAAFTDAAERELKQARKQQKAAEHKVAMELDRKKRKQAYDKGDTSVYDADLHEAVDQLDVTETLQLARHFGISNASDPADRTDVPGNENQSRDTDGPPVPRPGGSRRRAAQGPEPKVER